MSNFNIAIDILQATGVATPILVSVGDDFEWREGPDGKRKRGSRIGTRYTVLMQQNACAPLIVRTPEIQIDLSEEELAAACLEGKFYHVRFDGFSAKAYSGKNGLALSATAERATIITPAQV